MLIIRKLSLVLVSVLHRRVNPLFSETIRVRVLAEVPPHSLIRHLEKSDERVALAALSLMNALHDKSDAPSREQIVKVGIMTAVFFFIEHIWQK